MVDSEESSKAEAFEARVENVKGWLGGCDHDEENLIREKLRNGVPGPVVESEIKRTRVQNAVEALLDALKKAGLLDKMTDQEQRVAIKAVEAGVPVDEVVNVLQYAIAGRIAAQANKGTLTQKKRF